MVVAKEGPFRYAITNLNVLAVPPRQDGRIARRRRFEQQVRRWALDGVHFIQLREKSIDAPEVVALAAAGRQVLGDVQRSAHADATVPLLLVNGRPDLAVAAGADGVHLTAQKGELRPEQVRQVFRAAGRTRCVVSVSCHTFGEVAAARDSGADILLYGPVFEKRVGREVAMAGLGLDRLREACRVAGDVAVLALGGVTAEDFEDCIAVGAAGVAGIRLFE